MILSLNVKSEKIYIFQKIVWKNFHFEGKIKIRILYDFVPLAVGSVSYALAMSLGVRLNQRTRVGIYSLFGGRVQRCRNTICTTATTTPNENAVMVTLSNTAPFPAESV
jgi:hypothetical protein